MTNRGIYIVANDRVLDNTIALLSSLKANSPNLRIALIPYNQDYTQLFDRIQSEYGVELHENLELIDELVAETNRHWCHPGETPNQGIKLMNKFGCWFGQFDEFFYIDTDIIILRDLKPHFQYFQEVDFLNNDYQANTGIKFVFKQPILDDGIIQVEDVNRIFNAGFFGSKRSAMTRESFQAMLENSAAHPEYFYPRYLDQCLLNYWVQTGKIASLNLRTTSTEGAGSWAGSDRFELREGQLFDPSVNKAVSYLHWAGFRIDPDAPYWEQWLYYRRLNDPSYEFKPALQPKRSLLQRVKDKAKKLLKR